MKERVGWNSVPKFKHILTNEKKVVTFPMDFHILWIEVYDILNFRNKSKNKNGVQFGPF